MSDKNYKITAIALVTGRNPGAKGNQRFVSIFDKTIISTIPCDHCDAPCDIIKDTFSELEELVNKLRVTKNEEGLHLTTRITNPIPPNDNRLVVRYQFLDDPDLREAVFDIRRREVSHG